MKDKLKTYLKTAGYWVLVAVAVVGIVVAAIAAIGLLVCAVFGYLVLRVLLPGVLAGFLCWLTWTYFGVGVAYFPGLDPVYLYIPFLHFVLVWSTLMLIVRQLRKVDYNGSLISTPRKAKKIAADGASMIRSASGNWELKK